MKKATRIFYTLFLLTFVSQGYYGGTGDFLYAGVDHSQGCYLKNTNAKLATPATCGISKTHQRSSLKTAIRIKALSQNYTQAIAPFFTINATPFTDNVTYFSAYRSHTVLGINRINALRGPPSRIA